MNLLIKRNTKVLLEIRTTPEIGAKVVNMMATLQQFFCKFAQFLNAKLYSGDKVINACNVAKKGN